MKNSFNYDLDSLFAQKKEGAQLNQHHMEIQF